MCLCVSVQCTAHCTPQNDILFHLKWSFTATVIYIVSHWCPLLSFSGTHIWSLCALLLCPLTLQLRTTTGGRCSVLASQFWKSPIPSPRLANGPLFSMCTCCSYSHNISALHSYCISHNISWLHNKCLTCVLFQITYYNQATPGVLPYISTDIAGLSSTFYNAFSACSHFLETNKESLKTLASSALLSKSVTMFSLQKEQ